MSLSGIKILDLSRMLPGPYCSMMLADLGAEVIRVDDPSFPFGEPPPFLCISTNNENSFGISRSYSESAFNAILMRNKKTMTLNLKREGSIEVFYEMAKKSDVILESFRPGVTKKLKIDYDTIAKINPSIVYCSLSGYGQTGPYRDLPGHDMNYLGIAGSLDLNKERFNAKEPDKIRQPIVMGVQGGDVSGSFNAAIGILAAIIERDRNPEKKGQYIDISIMDCAFALNPYNESCVFAKAENILHGDFPYYSIYRTKDNKFLTIGAIEPKFWELLCDGLGLPKDYYAKQMVVRGIEKEELFEKVQSVFITKTKDEWMSIFKNFDTPVMPINNFEEACQDPQVLARDMVFEKDHPQLGKIKQVGSPIKMSRTNPSVRTNATKRGNDTNEILKNFGFTEDQIKQLKSKGIFR
jgi:crotonobetainyl-CoA:carnitine CoA-transferase CaiB-like acyl-CoA transferase